MPAKLDKSPDTKREGDEKIAVILVRRHRDNVQIALDLVAAEVACALAPDNRCRRSSRESKPMPGYGNPRGAGARLGSRRMADGEPYGKHRISSLGGGEKSDPSTYDNHWIIEL